MDSSDTTVIETHELSKSYKGVQALKNLNLMVKQHSIFGFLGPNGAGKTTTIKLLIGLARPTSGSGLVFGHDIQRESVSIRKRVGYLAQEPHYYEYMTARETLRLTASFFYSGPETLIMDRIEETLELVGLEGKADRPIKGFSGGEKQRLGIAQAQINYPDLLILDEPAASLDPQGRHDVLDIMERLRKYTTIFYSTHILDDVQRVSDTVAILNNGQLVAQAPIEKLLAGSGGTTYILKIESGVDHVREILKAQTWITSLVESGGNNIQTFSISVNNEAVAKDKLLRLALSDPSVTVIEFGLQKHNLEEVFLSLVEGGKNGH